ncbi:MAG: VOC family protein [Desulfobacterales bacterium]|nr:VOC family protein [Desulfobacterales bacterium]
MDHVPLAVGDLEVAAGHYGRLGFTLKPGRPHENGIRNKHVEFADGTEIELITAADARDALADARAHLAGGDGAAFVSLFAPDLNRVAQAFDADRRAYRRGDGRMLSFALRDPLRYVFFGGRTKSPLTGKEHFRHPNGAEALIGVWIAADGLAAERALLAGLGATITEQDVNVPETVRGAVAGFPLGDVVLLPGSRQLVPGRKIVGATVRVRDLALLRRALAQGRREAPPALQTMPGRSEFIAPDLTRGIWLEFREALTARPRRLAPAAPRSVDRGGANDDVQKVLLIFGGVFFLMSALQIVRFFSQPADIW